MLRLRNPGCEPGSRSPNAGILSGRKPVLLSSLRFDASSLTIKWTKDRLMGEQGCAYTGPMGGVTGSING